jgi:hypothetical protein
MKSFAPAAPRRQATVFISFYHFTALGNSAFAVARASAGTGAAWPMAGTVTVEASPSPLCFVASLQPVS